MTRTLTNRIRICAACTAPFRVPTDNYNQKTCSRVCRDEYNRKRLWVTPEDVSPQVWDGVTRFNDLPQQFDFWLTCALPTTKIGVTGVLLDPPYGVEGRVDVYNHESRDLSALVREWAISRGDDPLMRIALCGYEGEHEMPDNWTVVAWKAQGGYAGQRKNGVNENPNRERIWFSPHCLGARQRGLFD